MTWKILKDEEGEGICSMNCDWCPAEQLWEDDRIDTDDSEKLAEIAAGINGWASVEIYAQDKEQPEFVPVHALSYHICPKCQVEKLGANLLEKADKAVSEGE